jgi:hypothetical protein
MGTNSTTHLNWPPNSPPPHNSHYYLINGEKARMVKMPDGDGVRCQPTQDMFAIVGKKNIQTNTILDVALYTLEENFFPQENSNYFIPKWRYADYASSAHSARHIYSVTSDNRNMLKVSFKEKNYTEQIVLNRKEIAKLDSAAQLEASKMAASELAKSGVFCLGTDEKQTDYLPTTIDLFTLLSAQTRSDQLHRSTNSAQQK